MGMTDAFGGAESSVDAQKRALLAAVAQQGAAGKAAYEAQAAQAAEAQKAAVDAASKRTKTAGAAPEALLAQLHGSAADVTGLYHSDALVAGQHHAQEMDRINAANGAYMDQVKAAVPLARTLAQSQAAERASKESATERVKSPLEALVDGLGGQELARTQLVAAITQGAQGIRETPMSQRTDLANGNAFRSARGRAFLGNPTVERTAVSRAAEATGVDPATLRAFLGTKSPDAKAPAKAPAKKTQGERDRENLAKIQRTQGYRNRAKVIVERIAEARAQDEREDLSVIKARERQMLLESEWAKAHPHIARQLIRDYL